MYLFGLETLMPGIFLGLKFQACVFFWVCNMKLRQTPPPRHVYFEYSPWVPDHVQTHPKEGNWKFAGEEFQRQIFLKEWMKLVGNSRGTVWVSDFKKTFLGRSWGRWGGGGYVFWSSTHFTMNIVLHT